MTLLSAMPLLGEVAAAPTSVLFPLASYWWVYALFTAFVVVVLVVDLGVFHRVPHVMKFREAAAWVVIWVTLAVLFNLGLWIYAEWRLPQMEAANPGFLAAAGYQSAKEAASTVALQFLAGYIVEQSLSVDNIFVFVVIFGFFAVPQKYQHRVLFYGILGAVIFRAIFIALGSGAPPVRVGHLGLRHLPHADRRQAAGLPGEEEGPLAESGAAGDEAHPARHPGLPRGEVPRPGGQEADGHAADGGGSW